MAAVTPVAANFIPSVNAKRIENSDGTPTIAAETVAQGKTAYRLTPVGGAAGTFGLADANDATKCNILGFFENAALAGQVCSIIYYDPALKLGATLVAGTVLIGGATPGEIREDGDQAAGWYVTVLGLCISTTDFFLQPSATATIKV